jgi:hypothetical protein
MSLLLTLLFTRLAFFGLENRDYCGRGSAALTIRRPSNPQKLALTSPTSGCRSVGIVRSRTKATELVSSKMPFRNPCTAHVFFPEPLSSNFQCLRCSFPRFTQNLMNTRCRIRREIASSQIQDSK